jgi:hypothetical protein
MATQPTLAPAVLTIAGSDCSGGAGVQVAPSFLGICG